MKQVTFLLLFLSAIYVSFAQNITTDINVHIQERDQQNADTQDDNHFNGFFQTIIEQAFILTDFKQDTLVLSLKNINPLAIAINPYTFPSFQISIQSNKEDADYAASYAFDGTQIALVVPSPNCSVKITYEYNPISTVQYLQAFYFLACMYEQQSWFFTCPNLQIANVTVALSENLYLFSNMPTICEKNKYVLNISKVSNFEISLYVLSKKFYQIRSLANALNTNHIYFSQNYALAADSTTIIPVEKDNDWLTFCINSLKNVSGKIEKYLPNSHHKTIYVVDGALNLENMAWGRTISVTEDTCLVLVDTSFWNNGLTHELLHCYFPFHPSKDDIAFYLLEESLIEYLAVFVDFEAKAADAVFKKKMAKSKRKGYGKSSVFALMDNKIDAITAKGSSVIIYHKTPYIIHQFAQKIGGDTRFVEILSQYYRQLNQRNEEISFEGMKQFFASKSVTDKQWQWFERNL